MTTPIRTCIAFAGITLAAVCGTGCNPHDKPGAAFVPADSGVVYNAYHSADLDTFFVHPVMGYRFVIRGDFDGDGVTETLTEHYVTRKDGLETNKYYEGLEYGDEVDRTVAKDPVSYVLSSNPNIDTLRIADGGQLLGLSFFRNLGDINGDGSDEINFAINWADWSSLNTCHIITYRKGEWEYLYSFDIWDWQLPDLPGNYTDYSLFGVAGHEAHDGDDSINRAMEKNMQEFPGLVKKLDDGRVQIRFRNEEAEEDSIIIDFRNK